MLAKTKGMIWQDCWLVWMHSILPKSFLTQNFNIWSKFTENITLVVSLIGKLVSHLLVNILQHTDPCSLKCNFCVKKWKFWIQNCRFAIAALFGCIFAPALLENQQATNTTNTSSSCITICQKCISSSAKELSHYSDTFRYIEFLAVSASRRPPIYSHIRSCIIHTSWARSKHMQRENLQQKPNSQYLKSISFHFFSQGQNEHVLGRKTEEYWIEYSF